MKKCTLVPESYNSLHKKALLTIVEKLNNLEGSENKAFKRELSKLKTLNLSFVVDYKFTRFHVNVDREYIVYRFKVPVKKLFSDLARLSCSEFKLLSDFTGIDNYACIHCFDKYFKYYRYIEGEDDFHTWVREDKHNLPKVYSLYYR